MVQYDAVWWIIKVRFLRGNLALFLRHHYKKKNREFSLHVFFFLRVQFRNSHRYVHYVRAKQRDPLDLIASCVQFDLCTARCVVASFTSPPARKPSIPSSFSPPPNIIRRNRKKTIFSFSNNNSNIISGILSIDELSEFLFESRHEIFD